MPVFTISTTGGYFTSTTTWVGGVVPTSATTSDILGISTSGPLSMGGLGSRTVGSWDLSQYQNTITMTGSTTTMNITGPTFSMNAGITSSVASNSSNLYRFNIAPTTNIPVCKITMNGFRFRNSLLFAIPANSQRADIVDEIIMDENSWLMLGNTTTNFIRSATASVRGKITFDLANGRPARLQMAPYSTATMSYPHFIDLTFKNTGGGTNSVGINSQAANTVVGNGLNFIIDGGTIIQGGPPPIPATPMALGLNCNFEYISGTISPPQLNYYLQQQTATINSHTASVKANGIDWQNFSILTGLPTVAPGNSYFQFDNNFKAQNAILATQNFEEIYFRGTQSSTFVVDSLVFSSVRQVGVSSYNFFFYNSIDLFLYTGSTYSIGRIISGSIDTYVFDVGYTSPNIICGTGGGSAQIQLTNDSATTGTDYINVDIIGGKKVYALTGTYSGTTGIETNLPVSVGGGETSHAYIT